MRRQDPPVEEGQDTAGPTPAASGDPGARWMRELRDGDESAFERIVKEHQSSVYYFILRTLNDTGRAEDLTQDVFLRVYNARKRYRATAKFRTWLFTIAGRLTLNELRARKRGRRLFVSRTAGARGAPDDAPDLASTAGAPGEAPEEQLERKELEQLINDGIERLPPNQQAAIRLQRSEDFSYDEIAHILKVSTGAVKSLLVRAREALRHEVDQYLSGKPRTSKKRP